jgi:NADH-quinone oxidoreductase subunit N
MFHRPTIEYAALWPMLVVFGVACLGVVVEAFLPRERRYPVQAGLAVAGLAVALAGSVYVGLGLDTLRTAGEGVVARGQLAVGDTLAVDGPALFLWGLVLVFSLGGVLLFARRPPAGSTTPRSTRC